MSLSGPHSRPKVGIKIPEPPGIEPGTSWIAVRHANYNEVVPLSLSSNDNFGIGHSDLKIWFFSHSNVPEKGISNKPLLG